VDRREPLNGEAEPFLARWSRLKQDARTQGASGSESDPGAEGGPAAAPAAPLPDPAPEPGSKLLTDEDMPPVESLTDDGDYSGFLSAGVSELLRRKALRRLFSSSKFNVTDGLDDFAEDYTGFAPLGDVVTADMKHRMERLLDELGSNAGDEGELRAADHASGNDSAAPSEDAISALSQDDTVAGERREEPQFVASNGPQRHRGTEE
jgi:Protein of unknown function (DUF3306)